MFSGIANATATSTPTAASTTTTTTTTTRTTTTSTSSTTTTAVKTTARLDYGPNDRRIAVSTLGLITTGLSECYRTTAAIWASEKVVVVV